MQKTSNSFYVRLGTPLRLGVLFVLIIIGLQFISPVTFFVTPSAQAQEGGMAMVVALLLQMLMQLFQQGNTPQTGNAEEQPSNYGTILPTNSPFSYASPPVTPTQTPQSTLCSKSLFLAGDAESNILKPDTLNISQNDCVNFINGTDKDQTIRIFKNEAKTPVEQTIDKGDTFIFRFINKGAFKFCIKNAGTTADFCGATVTVGGN